ncbi:hypothetical protein HYT45_02455 [Candidatus Uhrbacteria bacterium]|nr:hypothetical protein [Candidatus Uhrbacteria bacterium]
MAKSDKLFAAKDMYSYFYDDFVSDKKHERALSVVENRLTDLGIQGRIDRYAPFRSPKEMLSDAVRKGAKTIVAVGNDDTVRKVIDAWPDFNVALGIIPIGEPSALSYFFGIPGGEAACEILSARIIERLDLCRVNNHFFLSHLKFPREPITVECEGRFAVTPTGGGEVRVCNFSVPKSQFDAGLDIAAACDPRDGVLDLLVFAPDKSFLTGLKKLFIGKNGGGPDTSVFSLKKMVIRSDKPIAVMADGNKIEDTQFVVEVEPQKLKIITGSERMF